MNTYASAARVVAYVSTQIPVSQAITHADEVFVSMRQAQAVVVHTSGASVVAKRVKATTVMTATNSVSAMKKVN